MRLGKIALFSMFVGISTANAQNVMVDLSVLDDLNEPKIVDTKPLFPVLPKKIRSKVEKKAVKPVSEAVSKKTAPKELP